MFCKGNFPGFPHYHWPFKYIIARIITCSLHIFRVPHTFNDPNWTHHLGFGVDSSGPWDQFGFALVSSIFSPHPSVGCDFDGYDRFSILCMQNLCSIWETLHVLFIEGTLVKLTQRFLITKAYAIKQPRFVELQNIW